MQGPDPLAHLACSSCRTPLSSSTASSSLNLDALASLAPCGHILCPACTTPVPQAAASTGAPSSCPVCGTPGLVLRDQATDDVLACFRPLPDLAQELGTAAGWQTTHLAEQLDYFKLKCAQQKDVLARVSNELKKVKALKQQVAQLNADNSTLRDQLSALAQHQDQRQGQRLDQPQIQHEYRFAGLPSNPPESRKRRLIDSPDRSARPSAHLVGSSRLQGPHTDSRSDSIALPTRPATHASTRPRPSSRSSGSGSSGHPTHLSLGPARLSLTPAQQQQAKASSLQMIDEVDERVGQASLRDSIAKFAYDPARANAGRTAVNTPRPAPHPHARLPTAFAPLTTVPAAPRHYDNDSQHEQHDVPDDSRQQKQQQYGFETDAQLMPPPPPPRRRHDQQAHYQQPPSQQHDAFVPPAPYPWEQPTPSRQHVGTPRPRFEATHAAAAAPPPARFLPAAAASTSYPPPHRPSSTAYQGQHGQSAAHMPFKPASAMLREGMNGGGGAGGEGRGGGGGWSGPGAGRSGT